MLSRGSSLQTKIGANGADVIRVQRALNAALRREVPVTGHFGTQTRDAVKVYKKKVLGTSKVTNGIVGSATWRALHQGRI